MNEPTPSAIPVADLLDRRVSFFESKGTKLPSAHMAVEEFLRDVRGGKWREPVEAVRTALGVSKAAADPLSYPSLAEIEPATQKGSTKERPLPAEFTQAGWHFRRLVRSERVCLYMKSKAGASGRRVGSWEVILPKHSKGRVMPSGNYYPDRETYPNDEDWGTLGWSHMSEGAALVAFHARSAAIDGRAQDAAAT
jgi:hypothetical protein